jgi:hypothetical protein
MKVARANAQKRCGDQGYVSQTSGLRKPVSGRADLNRFFVFALLPSCNSAGGKERRVTG